MEVVCEAGSSPLPSLLSRLGHHSLRGFSGPSNPERTDAEAAMGPRGSNCCHWLNPGSVPTSVLGPEAEDFLAGSSLWKSDHAGLIDEEGGCQGVK